MTKILLFLLLAAPPKADLVVVEPGEEVYSLYGHAGLLIYREGEEQILYNFGMTNFNRPNYITDFLSGRTHFWGKPKLWEHQLKKWIEQDRTVLRYPVQLSPGQLERLERRVKRDVMPEHREYIYDTFRDNCATRLRDYLDEYTGGAVYAQIAHQESGLSYHDDVRIAFSKQFILLFLIEIVPGIEMDAQRNAWEMSYRPGYLAKALSQVQIPGPDGLGPLLGTPKREYLRRGADTTDGWPHIAQLVLLIFATLLLLLSLYLRIWGGPKLRAWMLIFWSGSAALFGGFLLFVHAWTSWPDMRSNFLMLSFTPLDIILIWPAFYIREPQPLFRGYLKIRLLVALSLLILSPFLLILRGPLPPRVLGVALIFLYLSCLRITPTERDQRAAR